MTKPRVYAYAPPELCFEVLVAKLGRIATAEKAAGAPDFMGWPDRWYEAHAYRCIDGHVSHMGLKTDRGTVCLAEARDRKGVCGQTLALTFPEDKDGDLGVGAELEALIRRQARIAARVASGNSADNTSTERNGE